MWSEQGGVRCRSVWRCWVRSRGVEWDVYNVNEQQKPQVCGRIWRLNILNIQYLNILKHQWAQIGSCYWQQCCTMVGEHTVSILETVKWKQWRSFWQARQNKQTNNSRKDEDSVTFSSPDATLNTSSTTEPTARRAALDECTSFQIVSLSTCTNTITWVLT